VEREDPRTLLRRVIVREQRVVSGIDDGLAEARPDPHDIEHPHVDREAGARREDRPDDSTDERKADAVGSIGVVRDRDLQQQRSRRRDSDNGEDPGEVESECLLDVRQEHAEARAIEFVDGIEPEEDDERVHREVSGQPTHVRNRMADTLDEA
jgi:hypothetical protein